ncbi:MAG: DNA-directed RNA polymerase subunit omega [Acidobacteriota bacterium]
MQQIPEKIDSKFRFVLLAANRAEQIMRGAASKAENPDSKATRAAMEEILTERVGWEYGPEETPEADDSLLGDAAPAEPSEA